MPTETTYDQFRCAEGIDTATLSAWRDAQLTPEAWARLRAHVADCAACQRRLAQFDGVAYALATQRELEPGDRIVAGVRARTAQLAEQSAWRRQVGAHAPLALPIWLPGWRRAYDANANGDGSSRARDPRRAARGRVWGGLGAVASVAAVLLLFVYVFHALSLGAQSQGRGHPTPTGIAHEATATPTTVTLTPTFPPSSPTTDAQTAWGSSAIVANVSTTLDSTHVFEASSPSTDGRSLLGYELTLDASGAVLTTTQAQAGAFDLASRSFSPIGVADNPNYPATCCQDDGRFLVAADSSAPGATCGVCNIRLWSYDLTTGHLRQVATGGDFGGAGIQNYTLSNGYLVIGYGSTLVVANLATGNIGPLSGLPANYGYQLLAFTWPYIVYAQQTPSAPTIHAYDLATGQDRVIPQLLAPYFGLGSDANTNFQGMALVGDTVFYSVLDTQNYNITTLYELDHFLDGSSQAHTLAKLYTGPHIQGANSRVIVLTVGVWDLAQHRFVNGPIIGTGGQIQIGESDPVGLNSQYLIYITPLNAIPSGVVLADYEKVTVYDTSQLPVQ